MSKTNTELMASAAQTASANSASFPIRTQTMCIVGVDITAVSGSSPELDIWLQGSEDGGATWYDLPYDLQMTTLAPATDLAANASKRNINGTAAAAAISKHVAVYKHLPAGHVRLIWVIAGTTPSFTFSASLGGA